jgi:hypothetical protein
MHCAAGSPAGEQPISWVGTCFVTSDLWHHAIAFNEDGCFYKVEQKGSGASFSPSSLIHNLLIMKLIFVFSSLILLISLQPGLHAGLVNDISVNIFGSLKHIIPDIPLFIQVIPKKLQLFPLPTAEFHAPPNGRRRRSIAPLDRVVAVTDVTSEQVSGQSLLTLIRSAIDVQD